MLSLSPIKSALSAESYFQKDDYYTKNNKYNAEFYGKGAEKLGLINQEVVKENFSELLKGKLSDEIILKRGKHHRPGLDCTFSAEKTVSISALALNNDDLKTDMIQSHNLAVNRALEYMEKNFTQIRKTEDKITSFEQTDNIIAVKFQHETSRDLDPQLHTHCVIINATQDKDGNWKALSNEEIYKNKMLLGAIYRAELAKELTGRGYDLQQKTKGFFEIKGYTEEQINKFSQRRQDIEKYLSFGGKNDAISSATAALKTRNSKMEIDHNELSKEWFERAKTYQIDIEKIKPDETKIDKDIQKNAYKAEKTVEFVLEKLSERKSVFSQKELHLESLYEGTTNINIDDINKRIKDLVDGKKLIITPDGRYTTDALVEREVKTIAIMKNGINSVENITEKEKIHAAFQEFRERKGFELSAGQKLSSEMLLSGKDRVFGVEGYAGTGKTTMLEFVKDEAEKNGYKIKGYCPSSAAAEVLQKETGIESTTLASHLIEQEKTGLPPLTKEVWVIDEASMVSSLQAAKLLEAADKRGARIVFLGDRKQLSAVEAGKPFALLVDKGMKMAAITEIRRQMIDIRMEKKLADRGYSGEKISEMKISANKLRNSVYDAIEGKTDKVLKNIKTKEIENKDSRLDHIAADYLRQKPTERAESLLITSANSDKKYLNTKIREELQKEGTLPTTESTISVLTAKNIEKVEQTRARNYQAGDIIRIGKKFRGIDKGEYLKIEKINSSGLLELSGKEKTFTFTPEDLAQKARIEIYTSDQINISEGDLIRFTKNVKELEIKNGEKATILKIDSDKQEVHVQIAGKENKIMKMEDLKHSDHAYCITVHASQGMTCEKVFINFDTNKKELLGKESLYVAISRAKIESTIYTDNKKELPEFLNKSMAQQSALEAIEKHSAALDKEIFASPEKESAPEILTAEMEKSKELPEKTIEITPEHELEHNLEPEQNSKKSRYIEMDFDF